jgi:hypothetical protein
MDYNPECTMGTVHQPPSREPWVKCFRAFARLKCFREYRQKLNVQVTDDNCYNRYLIQ